MGNNDFGPTYIEVLWGLYWKGSSPHFHILHSHFLVSAEWLLIYKHVLKEKQNKTKTPFRISFLGLRFMGYSPPHPHFRVLSFYWKDNQCLDGGGTRFRRDCHQTSDFSGSRVPSGRRRHSPLQTRPSKSPSVHSAGRVTRPVEPTSAFQHSLLSSPMNSHR